MNFDTLSPKAGAIAPAFTRAISVEPPHPIETTYSYLPGSDATKTTTLVGSMQTAK